MDTRKKTFYRTIVTMLLSILFGVGALICIAMFFYTIFFSEVRDNTAAFTIMGALACIIISMTLMKYSDKIQRSFDHEAYRRLRNNSSERV